jgi:hypothetical protein
MSGPEPTNPEGKTRPTRPVLIGALGLAWIVGLVLLAAFSANPVTLNQKQIRVSDFVVTAQRSPDDSTELIVVKEWLRGEDLGTIRVTNLDKTNLTTDQEFLVPLQRLTNGRIQITPTPLPNNPPLVYPATPEAEAELQKLLESRTR